MNYNHLFAVSASNAGGCFLSERAMFLRCLNNILDSSNDFIRHPGQDFSRNRKLSFEDTFCSAFGFTQDSILSTLGISQFPGLCEPVAPSSFSKARSKIKSKAYKKLFGDFNDTDPTITLYKGYRLLSVDGSELKCCQKSRHKLRNTVARTKKGKTRSFYHGNIAYDVLNHTYVDIVLQPGAKKNEDKAWIELVKRNKDKNVIYITDRGYESQPSFYILSQLGTKFVCRIKDEDSYGAITKSYPLPIEEEYDIDFNIILTNQRKFSDCHPEKYKYINDWKKYGIFPEGVHELPLNLRLIRYKTEDENGIHWFSLITNIPSEEMETEEITEIYRLRWQCEVSYRDLKYRTFLENLHSRTRNNIESEVYAKMALYNLASRIRNELERIREQKERDNPRKKGRPRKWKQRINFFRCIKLVTEHLFDDQLTDAADLEEKISKSLLPVRPGRVDKRK